MPSGTQIHGGHRGSGHQSGPDGPLEAGVGAAFVAEADFPFGRMAIDVHVGKGDVQVYNRQGIAFFREQAVVGLFQGEGEHTVLGPAAVDEEVHVAAIGAGNSGGADEAVYAIGGCG